MKTYLIDTHILLWWLTNDTKLSSSTRNILSNPKNRIYISAVSAWEISIKKTIQPSFTFNTNIEECFSQSGFEVLPITTEHVYTLEQLPLIHKDPFDRMLLSQALCEHFVFISADKNIQQYQNYLPELLIIE